MYYARPEERHPEQRSFTMGLYIVTALSALLQFYEITVIPGMLLMLIAFFMVKAQRVTAMNTIYASHVEWTRRTLSLGTFIIFPLFAVLAIYLVYKMTDITSLKSAFASNEDGDLGAMANIIIGYAKQNEAKVNSITTGCITPPILWWVRRCFVGYMRAKRSEPVDYPDGII
jgi:hypothetical protein